MFRKVSVEFVLRVTEHRGVVVLERDVHKRRERREDGKLRELRDAGDHQEAYLAGAVLHLAVDGRERVANALGHVGVLQRLGHRVVIFVDEDGGGRPPVGEAVNGVAEILRRNFRGIVRSAGIDKGPFHATWEGRGECVVVRRRAHPHVEVDDGALLPFPVPVRVHDGEALEKVFAPLEHRLQRGDHQRLAKPPRTREEEQVSLRIGRKAMEPRRLVDVDAAALAKGREIAVVFGDWLHVLMIAQPRAPAQGPASDARSFLFLNRGFDTIAHRVSKR